jgi:hypothetical protein
MFSWSYIVVVVTKDRDMGEDPLKVAEAVGYLLWLSRVWGKWLWLSRVWRRWLSWDRRCIGMAIVSL